VNILQIVLFIYTAYFCVVATYARPVHNTEDGLSKTAQRVQLESPVFGCYRLARKCNDAAYIQVRFWSWNAAQTDQVVHRVASWPPAISNDNNNNDNDNEQHAVAAVNMFYL